MAALGQGRRELSARVAPLLGPPAPVSFEPLLAALVNEMAAQPGDEEVLLVLDDYHLISAPQVHESVGFLVGHRPPGLVVVLASRSDPPLALARLRAGGQLAELRAADLRFTPGEAAELLQHTASSLSDASLAARTEGWAAGLQLAALSLRGQDDVPAFVAAFTGSNRYVLDFLTEEVLDRQSGQLRTFLLETSVLDRLSGPLCDAVTGRGDSQALLEQIERAGLFLVPLDDVRGWWRYHHLFAGLLRARLGRHGERAAALHHNAAAWYERHGLADDAIGHAVAAGDMVWAARIIEKYFDEFYFLRGEVAIIRQWLSALPADLTWPTSGTSSTPPCMTSPRAPRCAGSSSMPRRWPGAWPRWRGSGRLTAIRPAPGAMAEAAHATPGPVGLVNPAPALRARLLLAQGDVAAGVRFVHENRLGPNDEPNFAREAGYLVLARVLLAQDRSAQALGLLDRLHTAAAAQDRVGSVIEVGALRALARSAAGDEPGAVMALAGTLTLACPQGYVRVFADEGAPMAALLGRLIAAQRTTRAAASVTLGYLTRLQRAFDAGPPAPDRGPSGIVDPLTNREFEVLEMLAAGRSNQAIARELVVTLDTVKKHVGHVLGKLGAANRTEAVARARDLNLIP